MRPLIWATWRWFIGANATGKSAILDALRFLSEAVRARDFRGPMFSRGGILNLAWKGQEAGQVELSVTMEGEKTVRVVDTAGQTAA